MSQKKVRLDRLLVERELVASRAQGQALILAGAVAVNGRTITQAGTLVAADAQLALKERPPYASRGGQKLAAGLDDFGLAVEGRICADVGASTGGFTDVLLQRGAERVYAIDVGYGQLDWRLRQEPRVVVMERVNARHLESLPAPIGLATVDVSFISLRLILPAVKSWLAPVADVVALIKPQFEAGRAQVGRGGVVRDPAVHRLVLSELLAWFPEAGLYPQALRRSPVTGPAGNVEFLAWLRQKPAAHFDPERQLAAVLEQSA